MLSEYPKKINILVKLSNIPEQFTFCKYFKQYVGISPKEYRQSHILKQKEMIKK